MKLVICVPASNYSHSNGILSLIVLCSEFRKRGLQACICPLDIGEEFEIMPLTKIFSDKKYFEHILIADSIKKLSDLLNRYDIYYVEKCDIDEQSDIVLYPEVYSGNPLKAKKIIRYFGNSDGILTGNKVSTLDDYFCLAHSRLTHPSPDHILFFSAINPVFFQNEYIPTKDRLLDLTYVGKGDIYSESTPAFPNSLEITRLWPNKKDQLSYILRQTRFMYTYDNFTNLNVEAVVCGAIPVFLTNKPYNDDTIDNGEFGYLPRVKFNEKISKDIFEKFASERNEFINRIAQVSQRYAPSVDQLINKLTDRFGKIDHRYTEQNKITVQIQQFDG